MLNNKKNSEILTSITILAATIMMVIVATSFYVASGWSI